MTHYYIKIALKNLWNNKRYATINIAGFSFSLCIFLAIMIYIIHEKSFDTYHSKSDRIYRLVDTKHNTSSIDYRVKDLLAEDHSGINHVCMYQQVSRSIAVTYNKTGYYIKNIASADDDFFHIFDVPFLKGNPEIPFENLNSCVITEQYADMIFGNEDPIGKELILFGFLQIVITGVIEDLPSNSSFETGIIVNAENDDFRFSQTIEDGNDPSTYRWPFRIYVEVQESANVTDLENYLNQHIELLHPYVDQAGMIALHDLYLHDPTHGSETKRGSASLINLLATIALIVLLLAVINYINLSISQQQKRGKEIGVRKTIGASRGDLIFQLLYESIIVAMIAFGIAVVLFELFTPTFNQVFMLPLSLAPIFTTPTIFITIGSVVALGIVSGLWPAITFSTFNPVSIFSKRLVIQNKKSYLKNALTIFQFSVSISLIFCVIVIWKQIDFSRNQDLGFDKEQLLRIDIPPYGESNSSATNALINTLNSHAQISALSLTNGVPGQIRVRMGANMEGKDEILAIIQADSSFLQTFDIKLIQGRKPLPGDHGKVCLINQTAMEYFEWENLENKRYNNGQEGGYEVIGVLEDFHHSSFHSTVEPLAILIDTPTFPSNLSLKISGQNIATTMDFIEKSWKETLSEYPLEYEFYDDWFNSMYAKEERLGKIIGYFSILGIVISCIGILGLAIFNAERKTKEIGIRKVNGASIRSILALLTKEYALWVLIAFVLASPISYYFMDTWLQGFAYKTQMSWWIFLVAGMTALAIAWITVVWNSLQAARKNPVDALRYE